MRCDYHLHTCFSDDSETPMEEMVQKAIFLGLDEICFTDHIDYGVKTDDGPKERRNCLREPYFHEISRLQEKYAGQITVKAGMEFGVQQETVHDFQKVFDAWPFDFIILSCHQIHQQEFWNQAFQNGKTQEEIHTAYYTAILNTMTLYKDYSVLGHLDMIKRYDPYGDYPDRNILPIVEKILRLAISEGKGIELNTSCYRYRLRDLTPSREILSLYKELGGEILTIGSDAHKPSDLADRIEEAKPILREIGFRHFCTFDRMQPVFHPL